MWKAGATRKGRRPGSARFSAAENSTRALKMATNAGSPQWISAGPAGITKIPANRTGRVRLPDRRFTLAASPRIERRDSVHQRMIDPDRDKYGGASRINRVPAGRVLWPECPCEACCSLLHPVRPVHPLESGLLRGPNRGCLKATRRCPHDRFFRPGARSGSKAAESPGS